MDDDIAHILFYEFKLQSNGFTLFKRLNVLFVRFGDNCPACSKTFLLSDRNKDIIDLGTDDDFFSQYFGTLDEFDRR